jgi:hypothetical protein
MAFFFLLFCFLFSRDLDRKIKGLVCFGLCTMGLIWDIRIVILGLGLGIIGIR